MELRITIGSPTGEFPRLDEAQTAFMRRYLEELLRISRDNRSVAAERAGVHRNTLTRMCADNGIAKGSPGNRRSKQGRAA